MMQELPFFLGLQIKQLKDEIFINQSKYIQEMLKKFSFTDYKPANTPMSPQTRIIQPFQTNTSFAHWKFH